MKIAVCVKLVPATTAVIRIHADGSGLDLAGVEMVLSPYDEFALEEALKVREKNADSEILVISVGSDAAAKVLEHAYALGVDACVLVKAPDADASVAAKCSAAVLKSFAPDLVFCGKQALDDDQWLFPGYLAELLDMPHVTAASACELASVDGKVTCKRRVEGGEETVVATLPAVVSCDKGLNEPRSPTLKGRLNAKKKQLTVKTPAELGTEVVAFMSALKIERYAPPASKSPGKVIMASPKEAAKELVRLLREEAKVL